MSHSTKEIDILKQLFENLTDTDKQKFLSEITNSKTSIQKVIQPRTVEACPHCQSVHFVKNGLYTVKYIAQSLQKFTRK